MRTQVTREELGNLTCLRVGEELDKIHYSPIPSKSSTLCKHKTMVGKYTS